MSTADRATLAALAIAVVIVIGPYVMAGPNDMEEFFTGVSSTVLAWRAIADGDWFFWTMDVGLGAPQPTRFHLIPHPLSWLVLVLEPALAFRVIVAVHAIAAVISVWLLARRFGMSAPVAGGCAVAYLLSSSVIQMMYLDDWPISEINELALPPLVLLSTVLLERTGPAAWAAALACAVIGGLLVAMSFPIVTVAFVGLYLFVHLRRALARWRLLLVAAMVATIIGGAHVYHLIEQVAAVPGVARVDHPEPSLVVEAWSAFMRPLGPDLDKSFRLVWFGAPFACVALAIFAFPRASHERVIALLLAGSVLLLMVPEAWLFSLITNRWAYRVGVNFFGVLAAGLVLQRVFRRRRWWAYAAIVAQVAWQAWVFLPVWQPVAQASAGGGVPSGERNKRLPSKRPLLERFAALQAQTPGRVAFASRMHQAVRQLELVPLGLAPNLLPMSGISTLNGELHGITLDPLYPTRSVTYGALLLDAVQAVDRHALDVLGVRYLAGYEGEPVAAGLRPVATISRVSIYENATAWPEAYLVARLPMQAPPPKDGCEHDRFLCRDFRLVTERPIQPVTMSTSHDSVVLHVPRSETSQFVVWSQWFHRDWRVTRGEASLAPALGQLIGVTVAPGETDVALRFFPPIRGSLFLLGFAVQAAALVVGALLVRRSRRTWHVRSA